MKEKTYYKYLDLLRILSCIAILLYHLNILKGGYLAVCCFFTLSGYLSCVSGFKEKKFSLRSYYRNRFFKIYLPLLIVIFLTIPIVSLFSNTTWLNLKPEVTSILLGYNNFWQISVNLDYFAHQISSPFMHLWYIAILLQFELIFPFIFIILKKLGDKIHKSIPCIILLLASFISSYFFYKTSLTNGFMFAYYNTFTRLFSLLFGLFLGFIHNYYEPIIPKLFKKTKLPIVIYSIILIILFLFIDANNIYFQTSMILASLITLRIIDYATICTDKLTKSNNFIKNIASITYLVYLWQYPIIFIFQSCDIKDFIKIPLIIIITILLSILLQFILSKKKNFKIVKNILLIIILIPTLFGVYQYIISIDHTEEMKLLEEQLAQNEIMMQDKLAQYEAKQEETSAAFNEIITELDDYENKLEEYVKGLSIVGIGDSVMLGAVPNLYNMFANGYFDAKVSRTAWVVNDILISLKNKDILGNPIVLNLGANGDCTDSCKEKILSTCEGREIFWINVTNDSEVHFNKKLLEFSKNHNSLHVIDWNTISKDHPEYFIADKIHLTSVGKEAYTNAIYEAIYNFYLEQYQIKREEIIKNHENEVKNKITFYGNELLINTFDNLNEYFSGSQFKIDKNYTFETLKNELEKAISNNTLTNKIVFAFNSELVLNEAQYQELINLCKDIDIYIVLISKPYFIDEIENDRVKIVKFYEEIETNTNYLMADNIHLTSYGSMALTNLLNKIIKQV